MLRLSSALLIRSGVFGVGLALFADQAGLGEILAVGSTDAGLTATSLIGLLAPAFFLWAVWSVANVFARLDRGQAFGPAMLRGLQTMGAALMLGAFCLTVVEPSLVHLVSNGFTEMRGAEFALNVNAMAIALVGLALVMLARRGAIMKAQLDGFV